MGLHGPYFITYQKNRTEIVSADTLKPVYVVDSKQEFTYFDGEVLIVYGEDAQTGEETMRLLDLEGNELFCAEDLISAQPQSSRPGPNSFWLSKRKPRC